MITKSHAKEVGATEQGQPIQFDFGIYPFKIMASY